MFVKTWLRSAGTVALAVVCLTLVSVDPSTAFEPRSAACSGVDGCGCQGCAQSSGSSFQLIPQCFVDWYNSSMTSAKRRTCWPQPHACRDRAAVQAPFDARVKNGWRRENTFGEQYFDEQQRLNEWGRRKIQAIMLYTPAQYRAVFVQIENDPKLTAARVASLHKAMGELALGRPIPPVLTTFEPAASWPAQDVGLTIRRYYEAAPNPTLPESGGGSGVSNTAGVVGGGE